LILDVEHAWGLVEEVARWEVEIGATQVELWISSCRIISLFIDFAQYHFRHGFSTENLAGSVQYSG
jgi:hypothetical protein